MANRTRGRGRGRSSTRGRSRTRSRHMSGGKYGIKRFLGMKKVKQEKNESVYNPMIGNNMSSAMNPMLHNRRRS